MKGYEILSVVLMNHNYKKMIDFPSLSIFNTAVTQIQSEFMRCPYSLSIIHICIVNWCLFYPFAFMMFYNRREDLRVAILRFMSYSLRCITFVAFKQVSSIYISILIKVKKFCLC